MTLEGFPDKSPPFTCWFSSGWRLHWWRFWISGNLFQATSDVLIFHLQNHTFLSAALDSYSRDVYLHRNSNILFFSYSGVLDNFSGHAYLHHSSSILSHSRIPLPLPRTGTWWYFPRLSWVFPVQNWYPALRRFLCYADPYERFYLNCFCGIFS